jgi:hypothetical protein
MITNRILCNKAHSLPNKTFLHSIAEKDDLIFT